MSFQKDLQLLRSSFFKLAKVLYLVKHKQKKQLKQQKLIHPQLIPVANHIYDSHGNKQSQDKLIHSQPQQWYKALSNEFG